MTDIVFIFYHDEIHPILNTLNNPMKTKMKTVVRQGFRLMLILLPFCLASCEEEELVFVEKIPGSFVTEDELNYYKPSYEEFREKVKATTFLADTRKCVKEDDQVLYYAEPKLLWNMYAFDDKVVTYWSYFESPVHMHTARWFYDEEESVLIMGARQMRLIHFDSNYLIFEYAVDADKNLYYRIGMQVEAPRTN